MMKPVNCIIIDDEPLARKGLREYIHDVSFLELIGEFENPLKAAGALSEGNIHLLFLDIQMPKISGLDLMKTLHNPPPVIFTTAFPEHALESYNLNALDYLVKPIPFERFFKTVNKAQRAIENSNNQPIVNTAKPLIALGASGPKRRQGFMAGQIEAPEDFD